MIAFAGSATSQAQTSVVSTYSQTQPTIDIAARLGDGAALSSSSSSDAPALASTASSSPAGSVIRSPAANADIPQRPRYGGIHEFSITAGVSRVSGPMWGYRQDVDYEVVHLRYSREMKNARNFTAYYSPEVTPYARLDEPIYNNNNTGTVEIARRHTTGGGVSPVGFTVDFLPRHHVQPFWESNYGILYFRDRVLSPQGSQFMHSVDMGVGMHIFESRFVSTTIGFRYNHMSNADISLHNPGTDAETWYVGLSRFHSPKSRQNE